MKERKTIGIFVIVIGAYFLAGGFGLVPLAVGIGQAQYINVDDFDAALTPLSDGTARLTITTDFASPELPYGPVWVNVRYALSDLSASCCGPQPNTCGTPGWVARLPEPIGKITAPGTYTYTLNVQEGEPVYVGLWTDDIHDSRTGMPWYGNEPYCSDLLPASGAYSFTGTYHWAFPPYAFDSDVTLPVEPAEPVSPPQDDAKKGIGAFLIVAGAVVMKRQ
jgi:hypothetical protein